MKISLFIGTMEGGGGAQKIIAMLANHYASLNWDVDIVLLLGDIVDKEHFGLSEKIKIVNLSNKDNGHYLRTALPWLYSIRKYLKESKPNVIVSFIGRINALVLTASKGLKIPTLISERSNPHHDNRGSLMLKYCNWIYKQANAIVFQTKYQASCFSANLSLKSVIIPNPLDMVKVDDIKEQPDLIITTGRLHPAKNQKMLVRAMGIVKETVPNARCIIYGEGEQRGLLQEEIEANKVQGTVTLAGRTSEVLKRVAEGRIFVMTSDYEGLSNSLMEAMMLGKICISTDYDGVEDIINDGVNGYVVPKGDAECLAQLLTRILTSNDDNYKEVRTMAIETTKAYDSTLVLKKWDEVINNIKK